MNKQIFSLAVIISAVLMPACFAAEVGQSVPECLLKVQGQAQPFEFKKFLGKVVYVDFWASWCGPCAKSFPFMNQLQSHADEQGLSIVAVNVDESVSDAEGFLANQPAMFPIVMDANQQCAKAFGVQAMPSTYLIDRKGIVRYVHLGFRESESNTLKQQVEQLLQESP